jgi:hypothetical protein
VIGKVSETAKWIYCERNESDVHLVSTISCSSMSVLEIWCMCYPSSEPFELVQHMGCKGVG